MCSMDTDCPRDSASCRESRQEAESRGQSLQEAIYRVQKSRQEARVRGQSRRKPNMMYSLCRKRKSAESIIPCEKYQCICRLILIPVLVILALNLGVESELDFVCYPNFTILITNPDPGEYTHLFAVQDEGLSTATKCTVTPDGSHFLINDCNATNQFINVYLSGRAASTDVDTFGGVDTISYLIECDDLASSGAQRIVDASLAVTLDATTQDAIQPTFTIRMDFRPLGALGNTISSAIVGRMIYWTIDFPSEYYAVPTCRAYAGTDNTGSPSLDLYIDGCSQDYSLALIDFYMYPGYWRHHGTEVKRLISNIFVFKFYNTDLLYFECVLRLCPTASACEMNCPIVKKRSISAGDNKTGGDFLELKTGRVFRISSDKESTGTVFTGNAKLVMVICILLSSKAIVL